MKYLRSRPEKHSTLRGVKELDVVGIFCYVFLRHVYCRVSTICILEEKSAKRTKKAGMA